MTGAGEMSDQPPGQDVLREIVARFVDAAEKLRIHSTVQRAQDVVYEVQFIRLRDDVRAILVRDAAAALSGASSPSGAWQPIETAPKDGPVLVANGSVIWIAPHPHISRGQGKCTHWMPLPASPLPSGDSK